MMSRAIVVVVPCFNEEQRLRLEPFLAFASDHPAVGFLFVDDGSTDSTGRILAEGSAANPDLMSHLALARNSGKGEAVRNGLIHAIQRGAEFVAYWDADLATPLEELMPMAQRLHDNPAMQGVLASRVRLLGRDIERRAARHYLGRSFATVASLVLRLPVYDTQCGAKIFRVSPDLEAALEDSFRSRWIFDVELLARLSSIWKGTTPSRLAEYPLRAWRDVGGSKLTPRDFVRAAVDLAAVWTTRRPAEGRRKREGS
jgi:glycosyltransferase involved in cell wall biosynthesis